jgi:glucosylceramidase
MIGDLNAGMTAFYDWNLVLDEQGGPNHAKNYCEAPFMYNTLTGKLEERNSLSYIAHFSRYILPGARRIAFSKYTKDLELTAFRNTGNGLAVVMLNPSDSALNLYLRLDGQVAEIKLPQNSIATAVVPRE